MGDVKGVDKVEDGFAIGVGSTSRRCVREKRRMRTVGCDVRRSPCVALRDCQKVQSQCFARFWGTWDRE